MESILPYSVIVINIICREYSALFFKRSPRGESAHEQEGVIAAYAEVIKTKLCICYSHTFILVYHINWPTFHSTRIWDLSNIKHCNWIIPTVECEHIKWIHLYSIDNWRLSSTSHSFHGITNSTMMIISWNRLPFFSLSPIPPHNTHTLTPPNTGYRPKRPWVPDRISMI